MIGMQKSSSIFLSSFTELLHLIENTPPHYYTWYEGLGCVFKPSVTRNWNDALEFCEEEAGGGSLVNYLDLENGYNYFQQYIDQNGNSKFLLS